jgi:DNA (cytosine-5)-methyltransferase 1
MLAGHRYIIENVPAPPIDGHALLCGSMFGLGTSTGLQLRRHRLFELWPGAPLIFTPPHGHDGYAITVVGNGTPTGNRKTLGRDTTQVERGEAMGIDWCNRQGVTQAVPPAYTEHIGRAILAAL